LSSSEMAPLIMWPSLVSHEITNICHRPRKILNSHETNHALACAFCCISTLRWQADLLRFHSSKPVPDLTF
jgi:hypothetical protein